MSELDYFFHIAAVHEGPVKVLLELGEGRFASWGTDGVGDRRHRPMYVWDGSTGRRLLKLDPGTDVIYGASALPELGQWVTWDHMGGVRIWDADTGGEVAELEVDERPPEVKDFVSLPNGNLAFWESDASVEFLDGDDYALLGETSSPAGADYHLFSDSGLLLYGSGELRGQKAAISLIDWEAMETVWSLPGDRRTMTNAYEDSRGRFVFVDWVGEALWVVDADDGTLVAEHPSGESSINGVTPVGDGRFLAYTRIRESRLLLFHENDWNEVVPFDEPHGFDTSDGFCRRSIDGAEVLGDGRVITWGEGFSETVLCLWDVDERKRLWSIELPKGLDPNVFVARDGGHAVVWYERSMPDEIVIIDLERAEPVAWLTGHTDSLLGCRQLDDGRLLSWSQDGTVRIWEVEGLAEG